MRLALFIGNLIQSYESEMLDGFAKRISEKGYRLDVFANCCVPFSDYLHIEGLKSIFYLADLDQYDCIFLADDTLHNANLNLDLRERLNKEAKCPVISLRSPAEDYTFIQVDNKDQIYRMTEHIIKQHGCSRIGFVTGLMHIQDAVLRLEGFKCAMKDNGLQVMEDYIFEGNYWNDQGPETADYYLNNPKGLPEAIICSNDYMALALIQEFSKRGVRVPEDVLITGMDNIQEARDNYPSLTTIDISPEVFIESAIEAAERIAAGENIPNILTVPGRLIFRASCGCVDAEEAMKQNYAIMNKNVNEGRDKARDCVYMSIDFGDVIDEDDCIHWAMQYFKRNKLYLRSFMVLNDKLRAASYFDWNSDCYDVPIEKGNLLPGKFEQELEGGCNVFFPINCKDEIYGYLIAKLDPKCSGFFDEVTAQLLITIGNTLKRLEMMKSLGEAKKISELYLQDPMTELYNRRGFERRVRELFDKQDETGHIALASIDLDYLKQINDNFGHLEGDRAIVAVADCLEETLRENEFAARMGGDEFAAVTIFSDGEDKYDFRRRLYDRVKEKNKGFTDYDLSISVGMADINSYNDTIEGFKKADKEMYEEKKRHHVPKKQ
ncbi:diguanylate cyclase (GGDEF) domain-containing protein [Eubacterium ruminantium]|nr:diguanylate cyclase (GGDEF) domain-containing protein [Eubacterium ruminantium]